MEQKKPSYFTKYPWHSVFNKSECETVALNIMFILARKGNYFRELPWEEYKSERIIDGNFSEKEQSFFEKVVPYCKSPETAITFSESWNSKQHG